MSSDPRDHRLRCSIWVQEGPLSIIVDTGPDFRTQCLRSRVSRIDAVLFTHYHADHFFGLDDVRIYNRRQQMEIPVYVPEWMLDRFRQVYNYTLDHRDDGITRPRILLNPVDNHDIEFAGLTVQPVAVNHGNHDITGYLFRNDSFKVAYLTDCKSLPETTVESVAGIDMVILSALWQREWQHPCHLNLSGALELAERLGAGTTYFTHITHQMGRHAETNATLPASVRLANDGLVITA